MHRTSLERYIRKAQQLLPEEEFSHEGQKQRETDFPMYTFQHPLNYVTILTN